MSGVGLGGIYRPAWALNIMLKIDESATVQTEPLADEFGAQLEVAEATPRSIGTGGLEPLALRKGQFARVLGVRPRAATVESPATRTAGKFKLSFAYADLPIDPRLIRSASVEIYLGSVSDADFAAGISGARDDRGRRLSQVQSAGGLTLDDNLIMVGLVDSWSQENGDKSAEVSFEGRDLRGYFLDGKPPVRALGHLDLRQPIASTPNTPAFRQPSRTGVAGVVNQILALCPFGALVTVAIDPDEWPDGVVPSPGTSDGATRVSLGAAGGAPAPGQAQAGQQATSQSSRPSAWDLITQYCFLVGAIPYFDGWTLRIRPARSYFELRQAGLDAEAAARRMLSGGGPPLPTPFKGGLPRDVGEPERLRVRRMVLGRDLKSLSFERKFQGAAKTPIVEVVGIDDTKRGMAKLLLVQYPTKEMIAARQTKVSPSGEIAQTDTIRIPLHGIRDKARLLVAAQGLYEEIGRQELGGKAGTPNLSSYGGGPDDPDLLRLRTGDAVEFVIDTRTLSSSAPLVSELAQHAGQRDFAAEVAAVRAVIACDEDVARAIVASSRGAAVDQLRTFKVANVRYTLSTGGPTAIDFDFQNYVTLRQQVAPEQPRRGQRPALSKAPGRTQPQLPQRPVSPKARATALGAAGAVQPLQRNVAATIDSVNARVGVRR